MAWTATQIYTLWSYAYETGNLQPLARRRALLEHLFNVLVYTHDLSTMSSWDTYAGVRLGSGIQETAHAMLGMIGYARLMHLLGEPEQRDFAAYLAARQQLGLYAQFCGNRWLRTRVTNTDFRKKDRVLAREKQFRWWLTEVNELQGLSRNTAADARNWFSFILTPAPEVLRFYGRYARNETNYFLKSILDQNDRLSWWNPAVDPNFTVNLVDLWQYAGGADADKVWHEYLMEQETRPCAFTAISNARAVIESMGECEWEKVIWP